MARTLILDYYARDGWRRRGTARPGFDPFVLRSTKPVLVDPLVPVSTDNVGWDGNTSGGTVTTNPTTIAASTTVSNTVFLCDVIFTNSTSKAINCLFLGGAYTPTRQGLITMASGGQMERCTIWGTHTSVAYYRNGIRGTGGTITLTRCALYRCIDGVRLAGAVTLKAYGCLFDRSAFFDDDADHASGTPAYWTHNDAVQSTGSSGAHEIIGCVLMSRFDITGVTWTGGTWGSGTAVTASPGGPITTRPTVATPVGMPATALNAGYWNQWIRGNWDNGFMFSNAGGHNVTIEDCWIEGSNDPSAPIQFTTGSNTLVARRNRFGVGGYRTLSTRKFLISYPSSGTTADLGSGADVNVFGDFQSCIDTTTLNGVSKPSGIVGEPMVTTSGGARYTA